MLELLNKTNCCAGLYAAWNHKREPQMTCVIKRGFSFNDAGIVTPLDLSPEIIEVDEYFSEAHTSSLQNINEISPYKLGGETYLYGTAYPEQNKTAMEVEYNIIFNDEKAWKKKLRITGKRTWNKILLGYVMGKPALLEPTVLKYENAFGGCNPENTKENFIYNPVGKGFNKASGWKVMNLELPNIEMGPKFLKSPPQQQLPAGYAPIPVYWEPRKKENGEPHPTPGEQAGCPYSEKSKISLHNVAPLDQRFSSPFVGGEKVLLKGFFDSAISKRTIEFELPSNNLEVSLIIENKISKLLPVFDTLIINTDKYEFYTLSRLGIPWNMLDSRNAWVSLKDKPEIDSKRSL